MSGNPVIAFGLSAVAMSYEARTRRVSDADVARFAGHAQRLQPSDADVSEMVAVFVQQVRRDRESAGLDLLTAVMAWLDRRHPERTADVIKSATPGAMYDWQLRADLR